MPRVDARHHRSLSLPWAPFHPSIPSFCRSQRVCVLVRKTGMFHFMYHAIFLLASNLLLDKLFCFPLLSKNFVFGLTVRRDFQKKKKKKLLHCFPFWFPAFSLIVHSPHFNWIPLLLLMELCDHSVSQSVRSVYKNKWIHWVRTNKLPIVRPLSLAMLQCSLVE